MPPGPKSLTGGPGGGGNVNELGCHEPGFQASVLIV